MAKSDSKAQADLMWKATSVVTTLVAGMVADNVVAAGWKLVTGRPAPRDEDKLLDYKLLEIATFAVISGAALALTRQLTLRQAAKWYAGKQERSVPLPREITV